MNSSALKRVKVRRRNNEIFLDCCQRHHVKPFRSLKWQHRTANQRLVIGYRPDCSRHGSRQKAHLRGKLGLVHALENRNEKRLDKRVDGSKSEIGLLRRRFRPQFPLGRLNADHKRLNFGVEPLACSRRLHTFGSTLKKLSSETLLKVAQCMTHRRRRNAKALCSLHKAPLSTPDQQNLPYLFSEQQIL